MTDEPTDYAQEGAFDPQLSFDAPYLGAPRPIESIVKRDGRTVPYDKQKIADAIFNAARTVGGHDRVRAEDLASGVTIFLAKTLRGQTPTVDQVHDAVEKVLIEMGHAKTALAYARYRDQRERIRRLRAGDTALFDEELHEAFRLRREPGPDDVGLPPLESVFVRTSGERLVAWDRARIEEALVRETDMDANTARLVAMEVEKQVLAADVRTLTAPLVRELVNAKLIEHGLPDYGRRHMRLGVPLYDARELVCGLPNGLHGAAGPEATDRALARGIKKEFALAHVFSPDVADAHLVGQLHLHDLPCIDRLYALAPSLDYVKRFAGGLGDDGGGPAPPRDAVELIRQTATCTKRLLEFCSGPLSWPYLNVLMAPFSRDIEQAEAVSADLLGAWDVVEGGEAEPRIGVHLSLGVPPALSNVPAVGTGGLELEANYGGYVEAAADVADAMIGALCVRGPRRVLKLEGPPEVFHDVSAQRHLLRALEYAQEGGTVQLLFSRTDEPGWGYPWQPWFLGGQRVTLNLVRAACESTGIDDMYARLSALVDCAAAAIGQRHRFYRELLARKALGPWDFLTRGHGNRMLVEDEGIVHLIDFVGLAEAVRRLTGAWPSEHGDARNLGRAIIAHLARCCATRNDIGGPVMHLARPDESEALERLATLDLLAYGDEIRDLLQDAQRVTYGPTLGWPQCDVASFRKSLSYECGVLQPVEINGMSVVTEPGNYDLRFLATLVEDFAAMPTARGLELRGQIDPL